MNGRKASKAAHLASRDLLLAIIARQVAEYAWHDARDAWEVVCDLRDAGYRDGPASDATRYAAMVAMVKASNAAQSANILAAHIAADMGV